MAAVTSDILNNMLRKSLSDLKSFVELLNAELTEEGQGEENRVVHKDDISRVMHTFGECEAYLEKSAKCLREVEAKVNNHFDDESRELIEEKTLRDEIKQIIKIIDGKEKLDDDRVMLDMVIDENKISQQLEHVQDILDEFHPMKYAEDAEDNDVNEEEEERISRRLEAMQKKAISKLEKRMSSVGAENDDEFVASLEHEEELTDLSDDEEVDYEGLERCENRQAGRNKEAKKNMDARLKAMWNDYRKQLENVQPLDTKQLLTEALNSQPDIDFQNLKHFSQYNNCVLDLFSKEAVLVVGAKTNYVDPISKKEITKPVRNTICNHIYEKDTIYGILKKKLNMRCPLPGCSCRSFTINDLVEDDDVATRINQNLARQKKSVEQNPEDMETEDEDDDDDTANVDTYDEDNKTVNVGRSTEAESINVADDDIENEDTQSQELF